MPVARRRHALMALTLVAAFAATALTAPVSPAMAQAAGKIMTTASGLKIEDSKVGTGATPAKGQTCIMH